MTRPPGLPAKLEHFIGGASVPSADGATFDVADPVTNVPYATVAAGGAEDIGRAVAAATAAFRDGPWPGLPARPRARILNQIADAIEGRADRIAELETFDTGLPVTQARGQAARAAENFRFFADMTVTLHEDAFRSASTQFGYVIRQPAGVAGLITPWNTPFMLETWKLAPALAAGRPVVLKPAEWTPLSASLLPEIMTAADLPDGVFNLVHGIGEAAGAALVAHPGVPRLSFTGETTTGQTIMAAAAPHLKGLSMELGGKSPCVIFADADLDQAVDSALFGVFSLNGERCTAGSRILAERGIYDALVTRLAERARRIRVGDPADPATEIGALVHPEHYARVLGARRAAYASGVGGSQINLFGLEIELWRINDSPVAPKFNVACQPNGWSKTVKAAASPTLTPPLVTTASARISWPEATTWPPRSSPTSLRGCGSSARRSSGRWCASPRSATRPRRSGWPTRPPTAWPPTSGPPTWPGRTGSPARSSPV